MKCLRRFVFVLRPIRVRVTQLFEIIASKWRRKKENDRKREIKIERAKQNVFMVFLFISLFQTLLLLLFQTLLNECGDFQILNSCKSVEMILMTSKITSFSGHVYHIDLSCISLRAR